MWGRLFAYPWNFGAGRCVAPGMKNTRTLTAGLALAAGLAFAGLSPAQADPVAVTARPAPAVSPSQWVNGTPAAQAGRVTVLLFWTRDCINCKHNLGFWNGWAKKYAGSDVSVVSVHTPETRSERSPTQTARFARQHGLEFPIAIDNDEKIWNAYGIESWPTEVLVDKRGRIRAEYAGELNWQGSHEERTVEAEIEKLRGERTASR